MLALNKQRPRAEKGVGARDRSFGGPPSLKDGPDPIPSGDAFSILVDAFQF
jgi:hypothetical protein